jgi:hypothetical protein
LDGSRLVVGIDGRELQGRPTGTGRYLRNLLRRWRETGDTLVVYFDGEPPAEATLEHRAITRRVVGDGRARGLVWQQRLLPAAARTDRLDVFFSPACSCPLRLPTPSVTAGASPPRRVCWPAPTSCAVSSSDASPPPPLG